MARGTTDPTVVASETEIPEFLREDAPADEDQKTEETPTADPALDAADGEDEDDEEEEKKPTSIFGDLNPPDEIGEIVMRAELLKVARATAANGDNITAQFETPWTRSQEIQAAYKKALELKFGEVIVKGATVKSTSSNTDADGAIRHKVVFTLPVSQGEAAARLFNLTGRNGDLTVNPMQMSLNLTARAE